MERSIQNLQLNMSRFNSDKKGSEQSIRHVFNGVPTVNRKDDRAICDSVTAITTLAIVSADVLHINIDYSPQLKELKVRVFDVDTHSYHKLVKKFAKSIYLESKNAREQLNVLEDKLIELVADAKDKAMGAV